ncbi:plasmolipin [Engraulis encrasicolus]|uniref:plasmolipin n=1 Tax=Engraulis encrasicolus TaxID=184585 RepID=UPI002FCF43D8
MADFPSKVNTQTSAASPQGNAGTMQFDVTFVKTIPAILMIVEMVLGLLVFPLVSSIYWVPPAIGWILFVSVTSWLLTTILFFMLLFGVHKMVPLPWPLALMIYHVVVTVLYFTAFITLAVCAGSNWYIFNNLAAASFFACADTVAYGASTFFSYLTWKGEGDNAAGATVPT